MIEVKFCDMLIQDVDVIVNPANTHMEHMGGLAGVIRRAAGDDLVQESKAQRPVPTGRAIITTAGNLRQKAVVHTVGPIWDDGESLEDELLYLANYNAVKVAAENGHKSIAVPAISCGIFRFPVDRAAPIAIKALDSAHDDFNMELIRVCVLDDAHYAEFDKALKSSGADEEQPTDAERIDVQGEGGFEG